MLTKLNMRVFGLPRSLSELLSWLYWLFEFSALSVHATRIGAAAKGSTVIGASVSEPHIDEFALNFLYMFEGQPHSW